jgi:hypothetical protein
MGRGYIRSTYIGRPGAIYTNCVYMPGGRRYIRSTPISTGTAIYTQYIYIAGGGDIYELRIYARRADVTCIRFASGDWRIRRSAYIYRERADYGAIRRTASICRAGGDIYEVRLTRDGARGGFCLTGKGPIMGGLYELRIYTGKADVTRIRFIRSRSEYPALQGESSNLQKMFNRGLHAGPAAV